MSTATAEVKQIKERPIIFSGPMVKAILEGRKTQTRRVIKPQPLDSWMLHKNTDWSEYYKPTRFGLKKHLWIAHPRENKEIVCPKGVPGDRLWVKETFGIPDAPYEAKRKDLVAYRADQFPALQEANRYFWRNVRNMPRWASRILLSTTNIRVERIQDISRADAIAEGIEPFMGKDETAWRAGFQVGWNEINAKRGFPWSSNPWVWCISFRRLDAS